MTSENTQTITWGHWNQQRNMFITSTPTAEVTIFPRDNQWCVDMISNDSNYPKELFKDFVSVKDAFSFAEDFLHYPKW